MDTEKPAFPLVREGSLTWGIQGPLASKAVVLKVWSAGWSWSAKYQWSLKKEGACIRGKANTTLSMRLIPLRTYTCVSVGTGTCSTFLEQDLLSEGSRIDLVSGAGMESHCGQAL